MHGRDVGIICATVFYAPSPKRFAEKNMICHCEQDERYQRDALLVDLYQHADVNIGCKCCGMYRHTCTCGECGVRS